MADEDQQAKAVPGEPNPAGARLVKGFLVGGGRFTLQQALGEGGMGVVWLAQDERLDERVALKFLPEAVRTDPNTLQNFRRETQRSRKLSHVNIVRIYDLHEAPEEDPFISMEYIAGPNLSQLQAQQPNGVLPWPYLKPLLRQLCDALEFAHGEGLVHRDLKPANLMVDSKGRLKLTDFGLVAIAVESSTRAAGGHFPGGTDTHMSPQQLDGHPACVADDMYALGAVLYELVTGRPPFHKGDVPHQVRNVAPMPITERLAELKLHNPIPPDVAAMVMVCLSKDPAIRPPTARAAAEWIGLSGPTHSMEAAAPAVSKEPRATERPKPVPSSAPPPRSAASPTPAPPMALEESSWWRAQSGSRLAMVLVIVLVLGLGAWLARGRLFNRPGRVPARSVNPVKGSAAAPVLRFYLMGPEA
jgi:serine/threonine protein kinase